MPVSLPAHYITKKNKCQVFLFACRRLSVGEVVNESNFPSAARGIQNFEIFYNYFNMVVTFEKVTQNFLLPCRGRSMGEVVNESNFPSAARGIRNFGLHSPLCIPNFCILSPSHLFLFNYFQKFCPAFSKAGII